MTEWLVFRQHTKEHSNVITTQSGKVARERSGDNLVVEKERKDR